MAEQTHDGFAPDRVRAENIWDAARKEARARADEEITALREQFRVEITNERSKWLRLVELLKKTKKTDNEKAEIEALEAELIGYGD